MMKEEVTATYLPVHIRERWLLNFFLDPVLEAQSTATYDAITKFIMKPIQTNKTQVYRPPTDFHP